MIYHACGHPLIRIPVLRSQEEGYQWRYYDGQARRVMDGAITHCPSCGDLIRDEDARLTPTAPSTLDQAG